MLKETLFVILSVGLVFRPFKTDLFDYPCIPIEKGPADVLPSKSRIDPIVKALVSLPDKRTIPASTVPITMRPFQYVAVMGRNSSAAPLSSKSILSTLSKGINRLLRPRKKVELFVSRESANPPPQNASPLRLLWSPQGQALEESLPLPDAVILLLMRPPPR